MYKRQSKTKQPDSESHAYDYCLFLLNLRLRSEGELRFGMMQRGYHENIIEQVIKHLYQLKYIDDARFAEILINNYKKYKNYGYMMIKKKLMEKRLTSQIIEASLDEYFTNEDELEVAKRFLKKDKLTVDTQENKQRVARRLQSRGFRGQIVSKLVFT